MYVCRSLFQIIQLTVCLALPISQAQTLLPCSQYQRIPCCNTRESASVTVVLTFSLEEKLSPGVGKWHILEALALQ